VSLKETNLKVFGQMSRRELKRAITSCFEYAPDATPVDRLAILQEAQFYTRELERRSDSWVSIRDFVLEIVVIGLIGWEIHVGYRQERLNTEQFKRQEAVLTNLENSSKAMVATIVAANEALQKQVALLYEVSLNATFSAFGDRMTITNEGRTSVTLWGSKLADKPTIMGKNARMLAPGVPYSFEADSVAALIFQKITKRDYSAVPFTIFVKNARGDEFVVRYDFYGENRNGPVQVNTILVSTTATSWERKSR
jgi:hypothetical protein